MSIDKIKELGLENIKKYIFLKKNHLILII
ncbi:hypothetical protein [Borreliella burgdorferi]|nr:hypothetical protein [Borreliella burgdorferi]